MERQWAENRKQKISNVFNSSRRDDAEIYQKKKVYLLSNFLGAATAIEWVKL